MTDKSVPAATNEHDLSKRIAKSLEAAFGQSHLAWIVRKVADLEATLEEQQATIERLRAAANKAVLELGLPRANTPAPVANAHEILRAALEGPDD